MVVDDLPALLGFAQHQGELAGGVAATGRRAGEEELAEDKGVVGAERAGFEDLEAKLAHGLGGAVGLFITGEDVGVAPIESLAEEGDLGRVFVGRRKRIEVATVPGSGLFGEHGADGGVSGSILRAKRKGKK